MQKFGRPKHLFRNFFQLFLQQGWNAVFSPQKSAVVRDPELRYSRDRCCLATTRFRRGPSASMTSCRRRVACADRWLLSSAKSRSASRSPLSAREGTKHSRSKLWIKRSPTVGFYGLFLTHFFNFTDFTAKTTEGLGQPVANEATTFVQAWHYLGIEPTTFVLQFRRTKPTTNWLLKQPQRMSEHSSCLLNNRNAWMNTALRAQNQPFSQTAPQTLGPVPLFYLQLFELSYHSSRPVLPGLARHPALLLWLIRFQPEIDIYASWAATHQNQLNLMVEVEIWSLFLFQFYRKKRKETFWLFTTIQTIYKSWKKERYGSIC